MGQSSNLQAHLHAKIMAYTFNVQELLKLNEFCVNVPMWQKFALP